MFVIVGSDLVYFSFLFSIATLVFLTLRMVAAFFMHDVIRDQLESEFAEAKRLREENNDFYRQKYRDYKRGTIQNTMNAIADNNIDAVNESLLFLTRSEETEDVEFLIECILERKNWFMLSRVAKECRPLFENGHFIDKFFELCNGLLDDPGNVYFVKSIAKSIGESVLAGKGNGEMRELFGKRFTELTGRCREKGYSGHAAEMERNREKQIEEYGQSGQ